MLILRFLDKIFDMAHEVIHQPEPRRFVIVENGMTAYAEYKITEYEGEVIFDIIHTFVPEELRGQGLASELVETAYDYAVSSGMRFKASCSYASGWLLRHMR